MALECALRPSDGLARLQQGGIDAAILDVMLPVRAEPVEAYPSTGSGRTGVFRWLLRRNPAPFMAPAPIFFNQNLVMEYGHPQAVADGVNVNYDVYRIRTQVSEQGAQVPEPWAPVQPAHRPRGL